MPFGPESFDKIYSVEAAQHFTSIESFIRESYRTLLPKGKLCIATFFATNKAGAVGKIKQLIETAQTEVDHFTPISTVHEYFHEAGFKNIKIRSIGKNVWNGYDKWISQLPEFRDTWNKDWLTCYTRGLVDYFIVEAEKA
jgi:cyclopropane fatty-acyl-phospholipid synthase-like methyltransferase